jgi:hypothetical protein
MASQLRMTPIRATIVAGLTALAMSVVLLLSSSSPAHAIYKQYCWGVTLPGGTNQYHPYCTGQTNGGQVPYLTEVDGSGANHAVCVWAAFSGNMQCSGGPNQGVYNQSPNGTVGPGNWGFISNLGYASNVVYGSYDYCTNPC